MKSFRIFILFLFTFHLIITTNAQDPQWINYTYGEVVFTLAEDEDSIWTGSYGGIVKYDKITGNHTFWNRLNSGLPNNDVRWITIDGSGAKWIGMNHAGIAKFDTTGWIVFNKGNSGLPTDNVETIVFDKNGVMWVGTWWRDGKVRWH
jgi:ligand-binding sensor domain-containing protein